MSAQAQDVARFVREALAREGCLSEVDAGGAVVALLPEPVRAATGLEESVTLRPMAVPRDGETALALESPAMRWLIRTAAARGRTARARLDGLPVRAHSLRESALSRIGASNGSLRYAGTRSAQVEMHLLELSYEAVGEERAGGHLRLAVEPRLGATSAPLADALIGRLAELRPAPGRVDTEKALDTARFLDPLLRRLLDARLAPLRSRLSERLQRDARRLVQYHGKLSKEAGRRGLKESAEARQAKLAAIRAQGDQKLRELCERSAVNISLRLSSVLVVEYPAAVADLVLLRRRREIPLPIVWDPIVREPLPLPCAACREPVLAFHACDALGHLTCAACARPCPRCSRTACRACHPGDCRVCKGTA